MKFYEDKNGDRVNSETILFVFHELATWWQDMKLLEPNANSEYFLTEQTHFYYTNMIFCSVKTCLEGEEGRQFLDSRKCRKIACDYRKTLSVQARLLLVWHLNFHFIQPQLNVFFIATGTDSMAELGFAVGGNIAFNLLPV